MSEVREGTYGIVYFREKIAIKRISADFITSAVREIVFLKKLAENNDNKHVVSIKRFRFENAHFYIHMDRAYGDLYSLRGTFGIETRLLYEKQLVQAVDYIHKHGIIHADIKPQNILVFGNCVKLCDFGISLPIDEPRHMTRVQTITYRAPEVTTEVPYGEFDETIDIWSLGCVLFFLYFDKGLVSYVEGRDSSTNACMLYGVDESGTHAMRLLRLYSLKSSKLYGLLRNYVINSRMPGIEKIKSVDYEMHLKRITPLLHPNPYKRPQACELHDNKEIQIPKREFLKRGDQDTLEIITYLNDINLPNADILQFANVIFTAPRKKKLSRYNLAATSLYIANAIYSENNDDLICNSEDIITTLL